jgi:plasmid stabilization system protein ParE
VTRQFRYYLVALNRPELALRFKQAVRETVALLKEWPQIAPVYESGNAQNLGLRSWTVARFEVIQLYFLVEPKTIRVIRILHGKQNVRKIVLRNRGS